MSNQALSNEWLKSGQGPGSGVRPGFSRFDARNALIKRGNYRGEAVFLAARRWHHSRAVNQAARSRLEQARREVEEAELAELQALHNLGIGKNSYHKVMSERPAPSSSVPRPGGPRDALQRRIAEEAAEEGAGPRKVQVGSRARSQPLERPGVDDEVTKTPAGDARQAWLAKMQGGGAAAADVAPIPVAAPDMKKPRRGGKAATTRD